MVDGAYEQFLRIPSRAQSGEQLTNHLSMVAEFGRCVAQIRDHRFQRVGIDGSQIRIQRQNRLNNPPAQQEANQQRRQQPERK